MTVSARAILAYLQLAPWNHQDGKDVQPRSGTEERSEQMEESSLGLARSRVKGAMCRNNFQIKETHDPDACVAPVLYVDYLLVIT